MAHPITLHRARSRGRTRRHGATWLPDAVAGGAVLAVSVVLSTPLLTAKDLRTGAGDWPAHAFRIGEVLEQGVTSWSHIWAGGMPLWDGYQALPHLLTAGVIRLTGLEVTQAMVLLAGLLLILLHLSVYAVCRWFGAPPVGALIGALTVCLLDTVRQPTANYSELWGLAPAPFMLYAGYRWAGRPGGFVVAALAGLSVEVHPLLAVTGGLAFAAGYGSSPQGRSAVLLGGQALAAVAGSAVFWLPVITSARPVFTEPYFTSTEFARLLASLATAGFLPGWPLIAAATVLAAVVALRLGIETATMRFLLLCGVGIAVLVLVSMAPTAPDRVRIGQLSRMIAVVPLLIGMAVALLAGLLERASEGRRLAWSVSGVLAALAILRGAGWGLEVSASSPASGPLARIWQTLDERPATRVLADAVTTARASTWAGEQIRFGGSYSGREWSILNGPLQFYLAGSGDARIRADYLVAHAVTHLLVPAGERPAIVDPGTGEAAEWRLAGSADGYDLIETPWTPPLAWHLPAGESDGLTVPDESFRDAGSAYLRDETVRRFAARSLSTDAGAATVEYPGRGSILVRATGLDGRRYLVVNENWDTTWQATSDGRRLPVERFGPNQIGVDLTGQTGEATILLEHHRPGTVTVGLLISLLALPAALALDRITGRRWRLRNHTSAS
ncbi:MAG: hypothetical protein ACRDJE_00510 [Dehalococcoidia bacterium]